MINANLITKRSQPYSLSLKSVDNNHAFLSPNENSLSFFCEIGANHKVHLPTPQMHHCYRYNTRLQNNNNRINRNIGTFE